MALLWPFDPRLPAAAKVISGRKTHTHTHTHSLYILSLLSRVCFDIFICVLVRWAECEMQELVVNVGGKTVGERQLYECCVAQKARMIASDESRILAKQYELLLSGKRHRSVN